MEKEDAINYLYSFSDKPSSFKCCYSCRKRMPFFLIKWYRSNCILSTRSEGESLKASFLSTEGSSRGFSKRYLLVRQTLLGRIAISLAV